MDIYTGVLDWLLIPISVGNQISEAIHENSHSRSVKQLFADREETMDQWAARLTQDLQMMFVSGETGEPSAETTGIIEQIVREQVVEIVSSNFKAFSFLLRLIYTLHSFRNVTTSLSG